ncbi:PQQ-dependent sugar dehydrogenase, partial [Candidatus Pelagibacter ubique]|nr:PQQ-dependent sugar dehydrogenase [Candidatus Pelagibacter ubique]
EGFYYGINNLHPGSGYVDFYEDNLFVLSSRGVLAYRKNLIDDDENFKQIKNNINEYIAVKQFEKEKWFALRHLLIFKDKIFISYTEEIKKDCWNTSVIYGDINYKNIEFKKLFSPNKCIHSIENIDKEFSAHQTGGKIIAIDNNHVLLSIGDYRSRHLAQDKKSVNGKIIKININNNDYKIISMGHRNPHGLLFDKENNIILASEHGPQGGDEINLIEVEKINQGIIQNYGWAIASYGEHYGGITEKNAKKYEKYPLFKSHIKHGFIEPLKTFVPSIGISALVQISKNKYVVSSLKDKSLYFFELNKQRKIVNLERLEVSERVRDLRVNKNRLYLFLEDTASIGILDLN